MLRENLPAAEVGLEEKVADGGLIRDPSHAQSVDCASVAAEKVEHEKPNGRVSDGRQPKRKRFRMT